jgi:hypothetical protein
VAGVELQPPNEDPNNGWEEFGTLAEFDQLEFIDGQHSAMQDNGWYFLPHSCLNSQCHLHVSLHGCGYGSKKHWIEDVGRYWGKYAASNDLVLLFPFAD